MPFPGRRSTPLPDPAGNEAFTPAPWPAPSSAPGPGPGPASRPPAGLAGVGSGERRPGPRPPAGPAGFGPGPASRPPAGPVPGRPGERRPAGPARGGSGERRRSARRATADRPPAHARSGERLPARGRSGERRPTRPSGYRQAASSPTGGLAPVYDIDGPRVRLGLAWFLVATAAVAYAVATGLAARQVVRSWRSVAWQADVAAAMAAAPVLAAVGGTTAAVAALAVATVAAVVAAGLPDGARLPGAQGRVAAAGILLVALVPALAGAGMVLTRRIDVTAALVLLLVVSAYEAADFIVGSGASNFVEGPLAGAITALVISFPMALILVPPFDRGGLALLPFIAPAGPFGQIMASALLPRPGAQASALRRIDSLLVLAPLWAVAIAVV